MWPGPTQQIVVLACGTASVPLSAHRRRNRDAHVSQVRRRQTTKALEANFGGDDSSEVDAALVTGVIYDQTSLFRSRLTTRAAGQSGVLSADRH